MAIFLPKRKKTKTRRISNSIMPNAIEYRMLIPVKRAKNNDKRITRVRLHIHGFFDKSHYRCHTLPIAAQVLQIVRFRFGK